jgi:hypothetical protein
VLGRGGTLGRQDDGVPLTSDEQPKNASGCLFLLLWACILLGLIALAFFAFAAYMAPRTA